MAGIAQRLRRLPRRADGLHENDPHVVVLTHVTARGKGVTKESHPRAHVLRVPT
jgi:hypothetical protein